MAERLQEIAKRWTSPGAKEIASFIRPANILDTRTIDPSKIRVELVVGDSRKSWRAPIEGDATVMARYRPKTTYREGYLVNLKESGNDLQVLNFQGAKQEGYVLHRDLYIAKFMAEQIRQIALMFDDAFERVTMQQPHILTGSLSTAANHDGALRTHATTEKYGAFISALGLQVRPGEDMYTVPVVDLRKRNS